MSYLLPVCAGSPLQTEEGERSSSSSALDLLARRRRPLIQLGSVVRLGHHLARVEGDAVGAYAHAEAVAALQADEGSEAGRGHRADGLVRGLLARVGGLAAVQAQMLG